MCTIEIGVVILLAMSVTISLLAFYLLIFYMFIKCLISNDWIPAGVLGAILLWFSSLWLRILG
jgi:hypothetical protein